MDLEDSFYSESESESDKSETEQLQNKGYVNKEGLLQIVDEIKSDISWVERLSVTTDVESLQLPVTTEEESKATAGSVHDDFKRELGFYCQAQAAAKEALSQLRELGIPTQRPDDYFAEMVKTDTHMQKVRSRLQSVKLMKETAEKKRKMRQMKKFGKKVQEEVLEKRRVEKKQMLKEVDRIRKGKRKLGDGPSRDIFDVKAETFSKEAGRGKNMKRKRKDDKYGYGGKKRMVKKNSATSSADPRAFNPFKHGKAPKKKDGQKRKQSKRPGKSKRIKQKMRKK